MYLGSEFIKKLIEEKKLVEGAPNYLKQIQPNGIDLTLKQILIAKSQGFIFKNDKLLPEYEELEFINKDKEIWELVPNNVYIGLCNESVNLIRGLTAFHIQRSTLARSGLRTIGLGDVGFCGQWACSITCYNPYGVRIQKNSRFTQLVFVEVKGETSLYNGSYQGDFKE
jgi:dCTP deaminase